MPVPYADSSSARDLKEGSKDVKIGGKPVGQRDKSFFKSAPLGNEGATKSFGGSLLTHTITGKTQFGSWSHDVLVEGEGVQRHRDLTTSNHGSYPGGTPPTSNLSAEQARALARVNQGQCPCCGSKDCPAAFQPGEEPLSLREFYGMDSKGTGRAKELADQYKLAKKIKKNHCECTTPTRVLPEPPCDVFRKTDPARTRALEVSWKQELPNYKRLYEGTRGKPLFNFLYFLKIRIGSHPPAEQAKLRQAAKLTKAARGRSKWGKLWHKYMVEAKELARVNHLVPKKAGGCPTNPNNLQAHQDLCIHCQGIDEMQTRHWQG